MGYKLSTVRFSQEEGMPVEPADSTSAAADILSNADNSKCPDGCFRPVGIAWDGQGRLFMTSDSTGEIYVLQQVDVSATGTADGSSSGTLFTSTSTSSPNLAPRSARNQPGPEALWVTGLVVVFSLVGSVFFTTI